MNRIAILDLGTNTFNLLIAQKHASGGFSVVFENILPVKIGKGGIHKKSILPEAMKRAQNALEQHSAKAAEYKPDVKLAFGTSALRGADNGQELIRKIKNDFGFNLEVIDGNREAELIYFGVREAVEMNEMPELILDIGGGSNEFIIANKNTILWRKSFDLGIARLLEMFTLSDPITKKQSDETANYFTEKLNPLFKAIVQYKPQKLIGASGTFDTYISMLSLSHPSIISASKISQPIPLELFRELYQKIIISSLDERKKMPGLVEMRLEMIVLATHFVNYIIEQTSIKKLWHSSYSLKEGAAAELFEQKT